MPFFCFGGPADQFHGQRGITTGIKIILIELSACPGRCATGMFSSKPRVAIGKTCIVVDDIIDSGGTIVNSAKVLLERGAKEVHVYVTHGVLSGEAVKKISKSKIKKLVVTDTIDNQDKIKKASNIEVLTISNMMAEAIKRISNSTSVSDLFK
mgnify:CR=1 FL=1